MVFFTSIIIVFILYYLQAEGLIYVTIVAVTAELINIFMTQTLTKSVEKKTTTKFGKIVAGYKTKIAAQEKTIKEFEEIQEKSVRKLYHANLKIKEYEKKSEMEDSDTSQADDIPTKKVKTPQESETSKEEKKTPEEFIDLPSGSNRKKLSI
ncbi:MAG: hypothetical protein K8S18_02210 [Desulfobacula sp.]|nr:hypothetical protein [Desulfobacula sp.]